jgi:hypothetical protein
MNITETTECCMNCFAGKFDERSKQVMCRRFPPTPTLINVPNPKHQFDPKEPATIITSQALPPACAPDWVCASGAFRNGAVFTMQQSSLVKP